MEPDYAKWEYTSAHEKLGRSDYIMEHGGAQLAHKMGYYGTRADHVGAESQRKLLEAGISVEEQANAEVIGIQDKIARMEKFAEVAQSMGGVEAFSRMIAGKDYAGMAHMISLYAEATNQDYESAASQLGEMISDRQLLEAQGYEKALDTIGRDQLLFTEVNKRLNEAAKFEDIYQIAKILGLVKNREDFVGISKVHRLHHAQETWTLDEKSSNDLNEYLASRGYNVRFQAGDRVTMGFTEDGITFASGQAGVKRAEFNLTFGQETITEPQRYFDGERSITITSGIIDRYGDVEDVRGWTDQGELVNFKYNSATGAIDGYQLVKPTEFKDGDAYYALQHGTLDKMVNMNDPGELGLAVSNLSAKIKEYYKETDREYKELGVSLPVIKIGGKVQEFSEKDTVSGTLLWAAWSAADPKTGKINEELAEARMKYVTDAFIAKAAGKSFTELPEMPGFTKMSAGQRAVISDRAFREAMKNIYENF